MKKAEALKHWRTLPENAPLLDNMTAIPYKAEGSKYGACGIRIDGNPAFVDAVLGRLKDILGGENGLTRLGLSRSPVKVSGEFKDAPNADEGLDGTEAEVCYIRLHERGAQARRLAMMMGAM